VAISEIIRQAQILRRAQNDPSTGSGLSFDKLRMSGKKSLMKTAKGSQ